MAGSGWYPDPGGAPGRYRYWDGSRWSVQTTDDPSAPPPTPPPTAATQAAAPPKRRTGLVIGILVLAVVLILTIVIVTRSLADRSTLADPDPPQSTVSGWDDSSPLPTATPPPTASTEPTDSADPQGGVACPAGDPQQRQPHPKDGRLHGGDLSFAPPAGYPVDTSYSWGMSWAYDTDGVSTETEPGWAALMAVGYVRDADGFHTAKQTVSAVMQCIASSGYYRNFTGSKQVFSRKITVDGHAGWAIRTEIRVDNPGLSVEGDVAEVIAVDTGKPGQLSFFGGFVPIGDKARIADLDRTIGSLRVG